MKKHILIFLLALLPMLVSAQTNDRIFELFGYTKFKLGDMTLSYTQADGLLVNGVKATQAQISSIGQALAGNPSLITSGGVYNALIVQNAKLKFSLDSASNLPRYINFQGGIKDTVINNVSFGILDKTYLNAYVKSIITGTAFTPPVTTVDNSVASPGYTVVQYFDFSDLAGKSKPTGALLYNSGNGNVELDSYRDPTAGNNIAFYSTDGNVISVANGFLNISPNPNIKIYYRDGFIQGKNYRFTFYNYDQSQSFAFSIGANGNSTATVSGKNLILDQVAPSNTGSGFIFLYNGSGLTCSALKIEVQN